MSPKVDFLLNLLDHLSKEKEEWAYLRNYECLPDSIGNDVDLLVREGRRDIICRILREFADLSGWAITKVVHFSPLTIYLAKEDETLHIDLFDRMEWHVLPFADVTELMDSRILRGEIWTLDAGSESFVNVMTRHIYEGIVREKHREQFRKLDEPAQNKFGSLLTAMTGERTSAMLMGHAISGDWDPFERGHKLVRRDLSLRSVFKAPVSMLTGLVRFVRRTVERVAFPPGNLVVFEGAPGSGKSEVIRQCATQVRDKFSCAGPMHFYWKPLRISNGIDASAPVDPQKHDRRGRFFSLLSLFHHWLGFQFGYWFKVRPELVRNRLVVGDSYAYDLLLNPSRYGLELPRWILNQAVSLVMKPSLTIALTGSVSATKAQKQELADLETEEYHSRLVRLGKENQEVRLVSVDQDIKAVFDEVLKMSGNVISKRQ
jgi:thymidylate kinase